MTMTPPAPADAPLLQIIDGSKVYGGLLAIEKVDFELRPGEIHALLGENGAGKSTLCKAIAGAIQLSSGRYLIDGREVSFASPREALQGGTGVGEGPRQAPPSAWREAGSQPSQPRGQRRGGGDFPA